MHNSYAMNINKEHKWKRGVAEVFPFNTIAPIKTSQAKNERV